MTLQLPSTIIAVINVIILFSHSLDMSAQDQTQTDMAIQFPLKTFTVKDIQLTFFRNAFATLLFYPAWLV